MFTQKTGMQTRDGEPLAHLGQLIRLVDMESSRRINYYLSNRDLTRSQAFMLINLQGHDGRAPLKKLEVDGGVAQSTTWGLAKRLEEKGLLRLETDPEDGRAKVAILTDEGKAKCDGCLKDAMKLESRLEAEFSPEEHAQFRSYLERMLSVIDSFNDGSQKR